MIPVSKTGMRIGTGMETKILTEIGARTAVLKNRNGKTEWNRGGVGIRREKKTGMGAQIRIETGTEIRMGMRNGMGPERGTE